MAKTTIGMNEGNTTTSNALEDVSSNKTPLVALQLNDGADAPADVTIGQQVKSSSVPVTLASDQDDINISLDGEVIDLANDAYSIYRNIDLDEAGANVKSSAGKVFGYYFYNAAATVLYLKFYNKASAPTVGTDTPVLTLTLPSEQGGHINFQGGVNFDTGIGVACTGGVADADTTAIGANECIFNLFYK